MPRRKEPDAGTRGRDRGEPGGGRGRIDRVGRTGVYPGSGPYPPGEAEVRTPASFVHGQTDEQGRPVEGGSEISMIAGRAIGGATPDSSSPRPARSRSNEPGKPARGRRS